MQVGLIYGIPLGNQSFIWKTQFELLTGRARNFKSPGPFASTLLLTSYHLGPTGPHRHPSLIPAGALDLLARRPPAGAPTGGLETSPRALVWLKVSIKM